MRQWAGVAVAAVLLTGAYFGYLGWVTKVWEGDSLAYHLPLAQKLITGEIWQSEKLTAPGLFYPGAGEAMLAVMMAAGVPLNWFNVLGWLVLMVVVREAGKKLGLGAGLATILGISIGMWPSVLRLILTQTVDVWLAVWWTGSWMMLREPKKTWGYWAGLGICLGMLVGTKYSGILWAAILLVFYGRRLLRNINMGGLAAAIMGIVALGGVWYGRNWIMTGNPVYPGGLLGWTGDPAFMTDDWNFIKTLAGGGWGRAGEALISEYLVWPVLGLLSYIVAKGRSGREAGLLGITNLVGGLLLPSWPVNIISDLRYFYPAMIPLTAGVFLLAKQWRCETAVAMAAIACMMAVFTQLDYHPKLFIGVILGLVIWEMIKVKSQNLKIKSTD